MGRTKLIGGQITGTASQNVETDSGALLTTAAKGTAFNKNFGTGSTDVATGADMVKALAMAITFGTNGKPTAFYVLYRFKTAVPFSLPSSLTGSTGDAGTVATASTVFSIKKNGTEIGTATYAAGGTVPTFAASSSTSFAVGDVLSVVAPGTADATLADAEITLLGTYT